MFVAVTTTLIHLLLSSIQIHDQKTSRLVSNPDSEASSADIRGTGTSPPAGTDAAAASIATTEAGRPAPTDADFLFRLGDLHVYGIRALFVSVVVGVSILSVVAVVYVALAHGKVVGGDGAPAEVVREKSDSGGGCGLEDDVGGGVRSVNGSRKNRNRLKRSEGWGIYDDSTASLKTGRAWGRGSEVLPSFVAVSAVSEPGGSTRQSSLAVSEGELRNAEVVSRPRGRLVPTDRGAVSFFCGRTKERRLLVQLQENAIGQRMIRSASSTTFDRLTAVRHNHAAAEERLSSGIPSYYFKEHDADGKSTVSMAERLSSETRVANRTKTDSGIKPEGTIKIKMPRYNSAVTSS